MKTKIQYFYVNMTDQRGRVYTIAHSESLDLAYNLRKELALKKPQFKCNLVMTPVPTYSMESEILANTKY